ncbi:hypothetical protein LguiA_023312 [Lonicera macranthoides]
MQNQLEILYLTNYSLGVNHFKIKKPTNNKLFGTGILDFIFVIQRLPQFLSRFLFNIHIV